jgi:hypothetical protein
MSRIVTVIGTMKLYCFPGMRELWYVSNRLLLLFASYRVVWCYVIYVRIEAVMKTIFWYCTEAPVVNTGRS